MLSKLIKKFNQEKENFQEKIKVAFKEELNSLTFPDRINSVGWTQYTPYFNDGGACEFSVYSDYLYINGTNNEEEDDEDFYSETIYTQVNGKYVRIPNPNYDKECGDFIKNVQNAVSQIPEEMMKDMFGDHVQVSFTRAGFEVEDYEHD